MQFASKFIGVLVVKSVVVKVVSESRYDSKDIPLNVLLMFFRLDKWCWWFSTVGLILFLAVSERLVDACSNFLFAILNMTATIRDAHVQSGTLSVRVEQDWSSRLKPCAKGQVHSKLMD
eukprot:1136575-Pelagomonas_calceolata.AAC.1